MPKQNIYLASSYVNKLHMREIRDKLQAMGHRVVSRWIDESYDPLVQIQDFSDVELSCIADRDMRDIKEATTLAYFTGENARGGAIKECGMAMGMALEGRYIQTVVVGDRRDVFDYSSFVDYYPTEELFLEWAEKEARR